MRPADSWASNPRLGGSRRKAPANAAWMSLRTLGTISPREQRGVLRQGEEGRDSNCAGDRSHRRFGGTEDDETVVKSSAARGMMGDGVYVEGEIVLHDRGTEH